MGFLIDTHTLLWWVEDDPRLTANARNTIADADHICHVSVVTPWEVAIKASLGKLKLAKPVGRYFAEHLAANDFRLLGVSLEHAAAVEGLPLHHRDPFDRLLAAQARYEGITLISRDAVFDHYGVARIW